MLRMTDANKKRLKMLDYFQLTVGYKKHEKWMLDKTLQALDEGNISYKLVLADDGVTVWRHKSRN